MNANKHKFTKEMTYGQAKAYPDELEDEINKECITENVFLPTSFNKEPNYEQVLIIFFTQIYQNLLCYTYLFSKFPYQVIIFRHVRTPFYN